jgi:uncharacterized glyoxalase superfamily protein PhnB
LERAIGDPVYRSPGASPEPLKETDAMTGKSKSVHPIPDGYHAVTPWILSNDTAGLLEFIAKAFGGRDAYRMENPDGTIAHAEIHIGDSVVMLFDTDQAVPTPAFIRLFVEDADAVYRQALAAGAASVTKVTELAFGDRVGRVRDPAGNIWWIQSHVEDVDQAEMERRGREEKYAAAMAYVQTSLKHAIERGPQPILG